MQFCYGALTSSPSSDSVLFVLYQRNAGIGSTKTMCCLFVFVRAYLIFAAKEHVEYPK